MKNRKYRALALAISSFFIGYAQANESVENGNFSQEGGSTVTAASVQAEQKKAVATPAESTKKAENRFVEKSGTGKTEGVHLIATSPQNTSPSGAASTQVSIDQARSAGGVSMDPSLREINLPGLKKDDPTLKPWVLHTRNGVNEVVKLSSSLINRIATPFNKPVIIDSTESITKIIGSDVYYTPIGHQPIGVFIVDSENRGQTISLTIMPTKNIPGQNLIVKMEDLRVAEDLAPGNPRNNKKIPSQEVDYHGFVRAVMSNAIRGNIPGYSIVPLEGGAAKIGHIEVIPDLVFSGQTNDVYRYKLVNQNAEKADLYEPVFYRKGVKAVSYFPRLSLASGENTYVFILADKPAAGGLQ